MSKNKRNAKHVTKEEEYLNLFPDDKPSETERMRSRALKEAQDIRKFEIDLYWKRTGFFWAFITVVYTALFAVLCKYVDCPIKFSFFVPVISALSGMGFFFSVAWHMVNKGSKFWQKNWENHVSLLEKSEIGPLYDVFLNPKTTGSRWKPTEEFDFSVTKVNMWASTLISILSLCICGGIIYYLIKNSANIFLSLAPVILIVIFTTLIFLFQQGNKNIEIINNQNDKLIKFIKIWRKP